MTGKSASIVLASSSLYRQKQLKQLGVRFLCASPSVDETPLPDESARDLALRLSHAKAQSLSELYPQAVIIGADQTAEIEGDILGKPLTDDKAIDQLLRCQGKAVHFYSGLCVIDGRFKREQCEAIQTRVVFRPLSPEQIRHYVEQDQPLFCAGSFKCESLGIALFSAIESRDPSALIGLPLIRLNEILYEFGVDTLAE